MDSRDVDDGPILSDVEQEALDLLHTTKEPITDPTIAATFGLGMERLAKAIQHFRTYKRDHVETLQSVVEELRRVADMLEKLASDMCRDMPL